MNHLSSHILITTPCNTFDAGYGKQCCTKPCVSCREDAHIHLLVIWSTSVHSSFITSSTLGLARYHSHTTPSLPILTNHHLCFVKLYLTGLCIAQLSSTHKTFPFILFKVSVISTKPYSHHISHATLILRSREIPSRNRALMNTHGNRKFPTRLTLYFNCNFFILTLS